MFVKNVTSTLKRMTAAVLALAVTLISLTFTSVAAEETEWDGKAALKSGLTYTVSKTLKVNRDFVIPKGATLNVKPGGTLLIVKNKEADIYGSLRIDEGGAVTSSAYLTLYSAGVIDCAGKLVTTLSATVDLKGTVNLSGTAEFRTSAAVNIYKNGKLNNNGYAIMLKSSVVKTSGTITCGEGSQLHLQGAFSNTVSGVINESGYMTIGSNGSLRNSGVVNLSETSGYNRFGTALNTKSGKFIDKRVKFKYEKMTVATLVDELDVELAGIDVSYSNGKIDWAKVAATGIDFAMIRAARGVAGTKPMKVDDCFDYNIRNAQANGIDTGVYFYSYATTAEEARLEAQYLVNTINGYRVNYPVVLDIEEEISSLGVQTITDIVEAFFEVVMNAGYYPMLYSYKSWLETNLDMTVLDKYAVWVAQVGSQVTYQGGYYIWQYSYKGKVDGISGNVDLDIGYRDFPTILAANSLNKL